MMRKILPGKNFYAGCEAGGRISPEIAELSFEKMEHDERKHLVVMSVIRWQIMIGFEQRRRVHNKEVGHSITDAHGQVVNMTLS